MDHSLTSRTSRSAADSCCSVDDLAQCRVVQFAVRAAKGTRRYVHPPRCLVAGELRFYPPDYLVLGNRGALARLDDRRDCLAEPGVWHADDTGIEDARH